MEADAGRADESGVEIDDDEVVDEVEDAHYGKVGGAQDEAAFNGVGGAEDHAGAEDHGDGEDKGDGRDEWEDEQLFVV